MPNEYDTSGVHVVQDSGTTTDDGGYHETVVVVPNDSSSPTVSYEQDSSGHMILGSMQTSG